MYKVIEYESLLSDNEINSVCKSYNYIYINYVFFDKKYLYIFKYKTDYINNFTKDLPSLNENNFKRYSDLYVDVDLSLEEWKNLPSYEGIYKISTMGRIMSLGNSKKRKDKIISPCKDGGGYWKINLCRDGKMISEKIHRLVVKTFIGDIPEGYHVDHINTNINDNRLSNLRILSPKENANNNISLLNKRNTWKSKKLKNML